MNGFRFSSMICAKIHRHGHSTKWKTIACVAAVVDTYGLWRRKKQMGSMCNKSGYERTKRMCREERERESGARRYECIARKRKQCVRTYLLSVYMNGLASQGNHLLVRTKKISVLHFFLLSFSFALQHREMQREKQIESEICVAVLVMRGVVLGEKKLRNSNEWSWVERNRYIFALSVSLSLFLFLCSSQFHISIHSIIVCCLMSSMLQWPPHITHTLTSKLWNIFFIFWWIIYFITAAICPNEHASAIHQVEPAQSAVQWRPSANLRRHSMGYGLQLFLHRNFFT